MPYSTANGIKIYYEVSGEGLPFVMVHANPFDHNLWMYQIAHFSTYFRIIAIDIRGYGRSDSQRHLASKRWPTTFWEFAGTKK